MEAVRRKLLKNPRENANIISILFFWWTLDIFKRGYEHVFGLEDLCEPLTEDKSAYLGDRMEKKWQSQISKSRKPKLWKALFATFRGELIHLAIISGINDLVLRLTQPIVFGKFLQYFRKDSTMTQRDGLFYGSLLMVLTFMTMLTLSQMYIKNFHLGMKLRISVCSLIYRKALRISQTALGRTSSGKIVNLLSNDVSRFEMAAMFMNAIWTTPLMAIIIGYLLWVQIQWAGMIGMVVVFAVIPIQVLSNKLSAKFRFQTATRTDQRARLMDEIISGIQVIKMYAWEVPFKRLITSARKFELTAIRKNAFLRGAYLTVQLFTTRMAIFCSMVSIAFMRGTNDLTASNVFVVAMYYNVICYMSQLFVRGFSDMVEAFVSLRRLETFLMYEEKDIKRITFIKQGLDGNTEEAVLLKSTLPETENLSSDIAISMKNINAQWTPLPKAINGVEPNLNNKSDTNEHKNIIHKPLTLHNINIDLRKGILIGIIGRVGSGKTSLLQAILRELPLQSGSVSISGSLSYACQIPWVFSASVRQNILFGEEMKRDRFDRVVEVCDLMQDFTQMEHGEKTIVGESGATLSGGQRARINLARAVYRDVDIYLLDDPLSAVDANVGRNIFDNCIGPKGFLAKQQATRILVTHQIHFLTEADWVLVIKDGKIDMQGSPSDISKMDVDLTELLDMNNIEKYNSQALIEAEKKDAYFKGIDKKGSKEALQLLEASSKGKVKGSLSQAYLKAGGNVFTIIVVIFLFVITQILVSSADYWVAIWTSQEEQRRYYLNQIKTNETNIFTNNSKEYVVNTIHKTDDINVGSGSFVDEFGLLTTQTCIYIHITIIGTMFIISLCRSLSFYTLCVRASQILHRNMFKGIISTAMHFFHTNPSGRILNRFAKDLGTVDEVLPKCTLDAAQHLLILTGAVIVAIIVNPLFLFPLLILCPIFLYCRKIYLKTSKNIKRLEGITRSPVFSHIAASLNGVSTIRAYNAEKVVTEEFDNHQDLHTACYFANISISSAFGMALDLLCVSFIISVTYSFLFFGQETLGHNVGLAITQIMLLTGLLQWGVRLTADVINHLTSVERILEYRDLKPEPQPIQPRKVYIGWPHEGKIEFCDVTYRYFGHTDAVLHDLNFVVQPNEKIGIIGRTGAGKSSLIGAIFRLAVVEGQVLIDDVDTATIKLSELRSKVSIIPQDPVLFSGNLRRNLDPFEEYSDDDIWRALNEVELKTIADGSGLQTPVMSGGNNFSVGQKQLLCLARAILRNNKILILDEATANVDPKTDTLIQTTIREKFSNCTILTVAHRLHTIIDSDRVLVIDSGKIIEFDTPHNLLQDKFGTFNDLVGALGPQDVERLTKVALEKHDFLQKNSKIMG